jgi:hypothetical protein
VGGGGLEWDYMWVWKATFLLNEGREIFRATKNLWNINNNSWANYELLDLVWQIGWVDMHWQKPGITRHIQRNIYATQLIKVLLLVVVVVIVLSSLVTGLFFLVLLLNQRWSPPLRLQVSHCNIFRITCDVPCTAVFCSESIEFIIIIIIINLLTYSSGRRFESILANPEWRIL